MRIKNIYREKYSNDTLSAKKNIVFSEQQQVSFNRLDDICDKSSIKDNLIIFYFHRLHLSY